MGSHSRQFMRRMPTFVPRCTPRLRRKFANRLARRSKSRQDSSRRYGASGCASAMRLASRQVTALSRSSDGLTSTSAVSAPYSRALRSRKSVMTMFFILLFAAGKRKTPAAHRKSAEDEKFPWYHLYLPLARPHRTLTCPLRVIGRTRLRLLVFPRSGSCSEGYSARGPVLPCTKRQLSGQENTDVLVFVIAFSPWTLARLAVKVKRRRDNFRRCYKIRLRRSWKT